MVSLHYMYIFEQIEHEKERHLKLFWALGTADFFKIESKRACLGLMLGKLVEGIPFLAAVSVFSLG